MSTKAAALRAANKQYQAAKRAWRVEVIPGWLLIRWLRREETK